VEPSTKVLTSWHDMATCHSLGETMGINMDLWRFM
jgi:hypothetical protein